MKRPDEKLTTAMPSGTNPPPHIVVTQNNSPTDAPPPTLAAVAQTPEELRIALDHLPHPWQSKHAPVDPLDPTNEHTLDQALEIQKKDKRGLTEIFTTLGVADSEAVYLALAHRFGVPFVRLRDFPIEPAALSGVPESVARSSRFVPLMLHKGRLVAATADPTHADTIKTLRFVSGYGVDFALATPRDIEQAIDKHYRSEAEARIFDALQALTSKEELNEHDVREAERLGQEKPVVQLVDNIITDAIRRRASDIHVHPEDHHVDLLFRIDGNLNAVHRFPKSLHAAVVSRIKILGRMNIAERRLPQDGRVQVSENNALIDLRVSIIPTVRGESVVIRILNTNAGLKALGELGFNARDQHVFTDLLNKSYGMLLVTGPTGCGKTTTLYAALQEIKKRNVNIITIEDPVEYRIDGIEQIQVHSGIGFTFARALRNILRHDPNVVMIGEIRDKETATIAVESALTGHLVLSTLHTNDAAGAVIRLIEMGIEPYLVSSSLLGVLAQRLVRRNCPHCLREESIDAGVRAALGIQLDEVFYRGGGCDACHNTGYSGRFAVYELLQITEAMRGELVGGVSAAKLRALAVTDGMNLLTQQALTQARQHKTSLAEVYRVRLS